MCSPFEQKVVTAGQENRPTSLQVSMATAATLGAVEGGAKLSCSTYTKWEACKSEQGLTNFLGVPNSSKFLWLFPNFS